MRVEHILAYGLLCMAIAAGLFQFVIFGMFGLLFFPIAIIILIVGGLRARVDNLSKKRNIVGLVLFITGVMILFSTAAYTSNLLYQLAIHTLRPSQSAPTIADWTMWGIFWPLPALLIALSLRFLTSWSYRQYLFWLLMVLAVCPLTMLLFYAFFQILPITA